jgi:hypothetical protein
LLTARAFRDSDQNSGSWPRIAGTILLLPVISGFVLQATALSLGMSNNHSLAVLIFLVILCVSWQVKYPPPVREDRFETRTCKRSEAAALGLVAGLWLYWLKAPIFAAPRFVWDDLTYHATLPATWLQTGSLAPSSFTYQSYFPLAPELFTLWFLQPLGADTYVNLVHGVWISMLVAGWISFSRNLGQHPALGLLAVACAMSSPKVMVHLRTFSGSDLAVGSSLMAALGFAYIGTEMTHRRTLIHAGFSGLAAGLAAGSKAPALFCCLVLAGYWLWLGIRSSELWPKLAMVFVAGALLSGSYWYLQDWILTGNPLFPAEIGPFDGPFSREAQSATSMLGVLDRDGWSANLLALILRKRLDWPMPMGLLSLAGLLSAPVVARMAWKEGNRERALYLVVAAASAWALLILYPTQPFSGTVNRPDAGMQHNLRFILAPFLIGLAIVPSIVPKRPRWEIFAGCIALGVLLSTLWAIPTSALAFGLSGAVAVYWLSQFSPIVQLQWTPIRTAMAGAAIYIVIAGVLGSGAKARAERATANLDQLLSYGNRYDSGWRALDSLPDGSRVTFRGNVALRLSYSYPLFGRQLQLEPVAVDYQGRIRSPLHEDDRELKRDWWWEFERNREPNPDFIVELARSRIDYILINSWSLLFTGSEKIHWPAERELLRVSERAYLHYSDEHSEIYSITALE